MEPTILLYLVVGFAALAMTWLPRALERFPLTVPVAYVSAGILLALLPTGLDPMQLYYESGDTTLIERATELIVIFSLTTVGIQLDRPFSLRTWQSGLRLIAVTMPLAIASTALAGHWIAGLGWPAAILLGACLAPTDPVLAEDVQVDGPHEGEEPEVRFALTLEAGLNDALAFPFVYLAMASVGQSGIGSWLWEWVAFDLVFRTVSGAIVGVLAGRALAWYLNRYTERVRGDETSEATEGLFIGGATLVVYSIAEVAHGYGFLAVFVAAVVGKRAVDEATNRTVHRFASQVERFMLVVVLLGFGGMLTVAPERLLQVHVWAVAVLLVAVVRPALGYLAMLGTPIPSGQRWAIAVFGIRGIGSIYYLAYAIRNAEFADQDELWPIVAAAIVLSMLLHGATAGPVLRRLEGGGMRATDETLGA